MHSQPTSIPDISLTHARHNTEPSFAESRFVPDVIHVKPYTPTSRSKRSRLPENVKSSAVVPAKIQSSSFRIPPKAIHDGKSLSILSLAPIGKMVLRVGAPSIGIQSPGAPISKYKVDPTTSSGMRVLDSERVLFNHLDEEVADLCGENFTLEEVENMPM
ncbi:hypothetical protein K435DRAFT_874025 [Dendrothele bispora CBS 962.96]|uniref:Uncharacterized protein n=1 Tax=Dendrothele bispora (strain CBS 962.96) TaxID=1314807 RepID=A0A4S8KY22_DENBC|nr:hypothetical protein K435DRAFT_874025 [Dendrothele bispora CBS 962.96]